MQASTILDMRLSALLQDAGSCKRDRFRANP